MQRKSVGTVLCVMLASGCKPGVDMQQPAQTEAEVRQGAAYGYRPLDPLKAMLNHDKAPVTNCRILEILPDETLRFAVGEVTESGSVSYGLAKAGFAGRRYVVVVDFMLSDTISQPEHGAATPPPWVTNTVSTNAAPTASPPTNTASTPGAPKQTTASVTTTPATTTPDTSSAPTGRYVPTYVGVGLRLTANLTVNSGEVDLGNLIGIGAAAEAKKVYGTLVIQTLGISGEGVASAIPIPSEISASSIQNALVAIGTIKNKIYDEKTSLSPRVVGIYDTYAVETKGGTEPKDGAEPKDGTEMKGFDAFFANLMQHAPALYIRENSSRCTP